MRSVRIGLANPSQILAHAEVFARSFIARSRCAVYAVRLLVALSRCVVYAVRRARRSFMLGYLRVLPTTSENYSIVDANLGM